MTTAEVLASLPPLRVEGRADRLRAAMAEHELDAFVVSGLSSVRWLTGFTGSNGCVVVTPDAFTLVTDGRYETQAPDQLAAVGCDAAIVLDRWLVTGAVAALGGARQVALEADVVTWAVHQRWVDETSADVVLVPTTRVVTELRSVKDDAELARIATAATIVDGVLSGVKELLVPGVTEREIGHALDDGIRASGASGPGYETIVGSGPNAALPHARPTDRVMETGDLVVIDVGGLVDGYRSDMTRTFVVGGPEAADETAIEIHRLVTEAQAAGVATVRPGIEAREVDEACRSIIRDAGHGDHFGHGTGHGVGLDIHELPSVHATDTAILQPGHVLTVEPGVYLPGIGGVRVEDLVVVTETGCRPLTTSPKIAL
ncbi:MAG: Xaa-Pro peptidase family protein [Actinomycetota bacterium]